MAGLGLESVQLPTQNDVEISSGTPTKKCEICKKETSKYTCPKCAARYCGVACYRSKAHLACSENFYKENVMAELQSKKATDKEKQKMIEILTRVNLEGSDKHEVLESVDSESLADRMEGLDLMNSGFEEIWARLSDREKRLFDEIVQEGEIELEELCKPWWLNHCVQNREKKISEIKEEFNSENEAKIPELIPDLPPVKTLLPNKEPSPLLVFNVSEVITVYAFIYRLYNGEIDESLIDALDTVISLARVLQGSHSHPDLDACLSSFVQSIKGSAVHSGTIDPIEVTLTDFLNIINSSFKTPAISASVLCLRDLHKLYSSGIRVLKNKKGKTAADKEKRQKYSAVKKKLYFMAAWTLENEESLFKLKGEVVRLQEGFRNYWKSFQKEKELFDKNNEAIRVKSKSKLIEELS